MIIGRGTGQIIIERQYSLGEAIGKSHVDSSMKNLLKLRTLFFSKGMEQVDKRKAARTYVSGDIDNERDHTGV